MADSVNADEVVELVLPAATSWQDVVRIQRSSGHPAPLTDVAIALEHGLAQREVDAARPRAQRLAQLRLGGGLGDHRVHQRDDTNSSPTHRKDTGTHQFSYSQ
jgi:hypothetical protein